MQNSFYGYIRVSSKQQNEDRQRIALIDFGVPQENIYMDKQSGKHFNCPAYQRLLQKLKLITRPDNYQDVYHQWKQGQLSARKAAKLLGISHFTFLKWAKS